MDSEGGAGGEKVVCVCSRGRMSIGMGFQHCSVHLLDEYN